LRHAKLIITVPLEKAIAVTQREALLGLKTASGFIRSELARRLPLRRVPELLFVVDREFEQRNHLLGLLERAEGELLSGSESSDVEQGG
jgi:ribosome-binding factor A